MIIFNCALLYCAKSLQSCPTICNPMDCSLPGSSVQVILQANLLEWAAMPSPGHLLNPGIEPICLMSPALVSGFSTISAIWEAQNLIIDHLLCTSYFFFLSDILESVSTGSFEDTMCISSHLPLDDFIMAS